MNRETKILLAVAGILVVAVAALFLLGGSSKTASVSNAGSNLIRDDSAQTAPGAKVSVVEFGDYQCPACAAAEPTITELRQQYPQVNFVFRNFPLRQHKNAEITSEAAEAAGAQGKYWEMNVQLYANQNQWAESNDPLPLLVNYATAIGLDVNKFKSDVQNNVFAEKLKRDVADGNALNVTGTPTFFVNGKQVQVSGLKAAIDQALSQ